MEEWLSDRDSLSPLWEGKCPLVRQVIYSMLLCTTVQTAATHNPALLFLVMFSLRQKTPDLDRPKSSSSACAGPEASRGRLHGEEEAGDSDCWYNFPLTAFATVTQMFQVAGDHQHPPLLSTFMFPLCSFYVAALLVHVAIIPNWSAGEIGGRWKRGRVCSGPLIGNCREVGQGHAASHSSAETFGTEKLHEVWGLDDHVQQPEGQIVHLYPCI